MALGLQENVVKLVLPDDDWEDQFQIEKENILKNVPYNQLF